MSAWLIALSGLIYIAVAIDQAIKHNWPLCIGYGGYAFSNIGFYILAKGS